LLTAYNDKQETILAKNPVFFQQQLAHNKATKIDMNDGAINLNFTDIN